MARRILVVEDSPTQAALIRLLLEGAGYQVDLAANGREGLERVQIEPPDLIISDVMMPEMDGYAFCQAVKSAERTRRIPFVLLTQRNTPEDILRGLTRGADNFIPKPFDDEYLLERVKRIFEHLEFRRKGQLDMDVTLRVGDRELVINADKQQIVELLFATFDDVCKLNQMLLDAERKLEDYALHLEAKVQERTEALRESQRSLEAVVETAPSLIVLTDPEGGITLFNRACEELTGYKREEVLGKTIPELFLPPEWVPLVQKRFADPSAPEVRAPHENPWRTKSGEERLIEWRCTVLPSPQDGRPCVLGAGVDITDRKRAEEVREKSERTVRAILDGAIDGILLAEAATGRLVNANPAMCRMLGYSREEIERLSVADIHPPDRLEYVSTEFEKQLRGETILARDIQVTRKDGSVFLADVNSSPLELDGRLHLLGIFRDITDRKRLEEERTSLEAQLRQQQKLEALGTLASGVAHEINNPITGVMNYAQLIADKVDPGSQAAEYAGEIIHETERVATIVRNLLQFSRQEKQSHSPARIADIIEQTLSLLRAVFRRDQIALTVDAPEGLPSLKCRSQQIQQVLMNLLTNARDALNEKYPGYHENKRIQVSCRPFEQEGRPWLRVTVADHGPGIPAEIQDRIFEPFFTTKPRDKGSGLGLSISHGIVAEHGGRLWFETQPGAGTQFHLDLPVDNGWRMEQDRQ